MHGGADQPGRNFATIREEADISCVRSVDVQVCSNVQGRLLLLENAKCLIGEDKSYPSCSEAHRTHQTETIYFPRAVLHIFRHLQASSLSLYLSLVSLSLCISSSPSLIFRSSHLLIFKSSHLHNFTSSRRPIFTHLLFFTFQHFLIFLSSHLSSLSLSFSVSFYLSLSRPLSWSLSFLPSCSLSRSLSIFFFSHRISREIKLAAQKWRQRFRNLRCNPFARNGAQV